MVVQGTIKISLSEQTAEIKLNTNTIHWRSRTICLLSDGNCVDQEGGYTFRNTAPVDNCKFQQYSILYEGLENKVIDHNFDNIQIMYSLSTQDMTFALTAKSKETVRGYVVIKTEHHKLLIFETTKGESFANYKKNLCNQFRYSCIC